MENIDHIGFTKSIIQYFSKNWLTCPQRTLIAGYSHGGHMCYCLALELGSRYIAEVAIHCPTLRTEDNSDCATRKKPDLRVLAKQGRIMNLAACFRSQDGTIWIGHNGGMHEPTSSNIQIKWRALATPSSENGQVEKYEDAFVRAPLKCNKLTDNSAQSSSYHVLLNLESKDTASIRRCLSPPYTLCDRSRSHVSTMKNAKTCKINDYSAMSCLCAPSCSITFTTSTKHYSRPSSQGHRLTFTPSIRKDISPPSIPFVTDHNYILPSVNNLDSSQAWIQHDRTRHSPTPRCSDRRAHIASKLVRVGVTHKTAFRMLDAQIKTNSKSVFISVFPDDAVASHLSALPADFKLTSSRKIKRFKSITSPEKKINTLPPPKDAVKSEFTPKVLLNHKA
ncbi:hypothetical protein PSTG_13105 [Puccinia striiformis f. sp. tritici PST-78]|uniref:Uncharacterized protein n=1 Tax=Puccinia striiformis f. sp. tritici PST-78 TaxID=1165861 RepID=A0A0L0V2G2_9BASI|nr:hypothetical protein PSTG_13103 [Puccinia striiformis f. sp. tritici PST-78]KNE93473.1 hypothetical protein PSTG_13105 [Puccinia striiformis f. sp. tritici PST-78]